MIDNYLQVELALDVERMVPDFIRRKFVVRKESLSPNAGFSVYFSKTFGLESYGLTAQNINKALNPELVCELNLGVVKVEIIVLFVIRAFQIVPIFYFDEFKTTRKRFLTIL